MKVLAMIQIVHIKCLYSSSSVLKTVLCSGDKTKFQDKRLLAYSQGVYHEGIIFCSKKAARTAFKI
jgi:hypothetical protein